MLDPGLTGAEIVVPSYGSPNASVAIIGEAPGENEALQGRPFVGRAGAEQRRYLANEGFAVSSAWLANVNRTYRPGNPDPSPADIARWTPVLLNELTTNKPAFILPVGRFAVRWFLGDVDLDAVHGIPHRSYRFTNGHIPQSYCPVILPCYHPAAGFYDTDAMVLIKYDYERAVLAIRGKIDTTPPIDDVPCDYIDVSGAELALIIATQRSRIDAFGVDTEGIPTNTWSIQVSFDDGVGYVLRCARADFALGIRAIQSLVDDPRVTCALHNGMYDIEMCRIMGLDLFDATLFDSMYAAYIMRVQPQGLKPLAYRWTGMRMQSYDETVGPVGLEKQLDYIGRVLADSDRYTAKPDPRIEYSNDGTTRLYTPQSVVRRAEAILVDYYSGKVDKDGNRCDPHKRWRQVDRELREEVEAVLGPMPIGTLADIALPKAIAYAGRDPDATLRLRRRLVPELARQGLTQLMADGMSVLPVFEQMQSSGMPASRPYFERLQSRMWEEMCRLQTRISHRYFQGRPFNPASSDQVATLMRRRGLVGEKRSKKTGKMSTAKKSIEHLRYSDDAMSDVIVWREHQKVRDAFCTPVLERIPRDVDTFPVRCSIKTTRVTSRRISASDPNLTAIPVRNELGKDVRDGYIAPDGELFGNWDLSQAEMRVMAGLSKDPLLLKMFLEKRDPHAETASRIFGIPLADVDEMKHRYPSKRAGFGVITNIAGPGLLDQLRMFGCTGWDEDSCTRLIAEWLKVYKGVAVFLEDCKREVRAKGVVYDYWGMPRHLPGVWSDDRKVQGEAERAASSHLIQGGAQGMLQRSMAYLKPYIRALQLAGANVSFVLQIHDSLILRFDEDLWDTLNPLVMEALIDHHTMKLGVPMDAKGAKAKSWGKLK